MSEPGSPRRATVRQLATAPLLAAIYLPPALAINAVSTAALKWLGVPCPAQAVLTNWAQMGGGARMLALAAALLVSPILEETLFRWLLPAGLRHLHCSEKLAAGLAAAAFALVHPIPWGWPALFLFALAQSIVLARRGLTYAICVHSCYNALQLAIATLLSQA